MKHKACDDSGANDGRGDGQQEAASFRRCGRGGGACSRGVGWRRGPTWMRRASVCCGDPGHAGGDELVFGGPKCPEGKGKLAHRRKAMGGIFFQAAKHNGSEALGHVRTNGAQGGRGGVAGAAGETAGVAGAVAGVAAGVVGVAGGVAGVAGVAGGVVGVAGASGGFGVGTEPSIFSPGVGGGTPGMSGEGAGVGGGVGRGEPPVFLPAAFLISSSNCRASNTNGLP